MVSICLVLCTSGLYAQIDFKGTGSVTNNGISLVPSFSLGDPALLFDLKLIHKRFSFEPDMRFALEGKPWSMLFWFRYKAVKRNRFSLRLGAHPALNFRTVPVVRDGKTEELIESRRYVAAEIVPSYRISDNLDIGVYYLWGHGFDAGVTRTHFLVFNLNFKKIYMAADYYISVSPQLYHLRSDNLKGYYAVAFISLAKDNFPLSISAILNKALDTEVLPEQNFTWNLSLVYRFNKLRDVSTEAVSPTENGGL